MVPLGGFADTATPEPQVTTSVEETALGADDSMTDPVVVSSTDSPATPPTSGSGFVGTSASDDDDEDEDEDDDDYESEDDD